MKMKRTALHRTSLLRAAFFAACITLAASCALGEDVESPPPGTVLRDCAVCPEMVVVPAGNLMMGNPGGEEGADWREFPLHHVTIPSAFAVGKYEVTFAEWDACVEDGGCSGYWPNDEGWGRTDRPVINVSWNDTQAYVTWLSRVTGNSYRLPSESEWEYVARAGTTSPFHFGSTISIDQANYDGDHTYLSGLPGVNRRKTMPAGSFGANGFGLHDIHGNVWEYVEDCSYYDYRGAPSDGSVWEGEDYDCSGRVLRGGGWFSSPRSLRSAKRIGSRTDFWTYSSVGFRVVQTLTR